MTATLDVILFAVKEFLTTNSGKPVGAQEVPEDTTLPYSVVYYLGAVKYNGSFQYPEDNREVMMQITSVGQDPQQTGWMSSKMQSAMTGRDANGIRLYQLAIAGENVQGIYTEQSGQPEQSGQKLWQVVDRYRIMIGA